MAITAEGMEENGEEIKTASSSHFNVNARTVNIDGPSIGIVTRVEHELVV